MVERADISEINATYAHGVRTLEETQAAGIEAEKQIKKIQSSQAAAMADEALSELIEKGETIVESFEADASLLQELQNGLKKKGFGGAALLIVDDGSKLETSSGGSLWGRCCCQGLEGWEYFARAGCYWRR